MGTLLLEHLAAIARANGIREFESYVLGENNRMLQVFETSGFRIQRSIDTGVFHVSFPTEETVQVRAAEAHRERLAAAQSVRAFLHPRAVATAERLGYPLVAKAISPDVLHKSDVGGVILGLDSAAAVAAAVETLVERLHKVGARLDGILLQRQVSGDLEALVDVTPDPTFGPLVVCGLEGTLVEALVESIPELRELDLNPVKILSPGQGAIVVDGRMRLGPLPEVGQPRPETVVHTP